MRPGPSKQFDPDLALERARDLFWRRGYDGTALSELEHELGIGRKSLYDTFGSKRVLFLLALEQYADSVIAHICARLQHAEGTPLANLERALGGLARHHGSGESSGCLLGVAMAQADRDDHELAALLRAYLLRLERAFERTLVRAKDAGEVRADLEPRDVARQLVALTQGMALMGRVGASASEPRAVVNATLAALRP